MFKALTDKAQQAASAATSAVSDVASAATNVASTAASAATNAAATAASAATNVVSSATNMVSDATNGVKNLGLDISDEISGHSKDAKEEKSKFTFEEKDGVSKEDTFISAIEDGEISVMMDMLYHMDEIELDINNIRDANGFSPLRLAISKGYSGIVEQLLKFGADVGDGLLRAVDVGFLETVKIIIKYAQELEGNEYTRAILDCRCDGDDYHPDVTPIVLAAQQNDFAIVKELSNAGCKIRSIAMKKRRVSKKEKRRLSFHPTSQATDDLQKSVGSLEVYSGLASKAYLIQGNEDPIDAAFKLSKKLRDLGQSDVEHRPKYEELAENVNEVSPELIAFARNTEEILTILTYDDTNDPAEEHETMRGPLPKISKAIDVEQKAFVAHPNCQQAVLAKFYGQQAFLRDKSSSYNFFYLMLMIVGFPFLSFAYLYLPIKRVNDFMKCPYTKFAMKLASDVFFVALLTGDAIIHPAITHELTLATPTTAILMFWIFGIFWRELKLIYHHGMPKIKDLGHWRDLLLVIFFLFGVLFDIASYMEFKKAAARDANLKFKRDLDPYDQQQVDAQIFYKSLQQENFPIHFEPEMRKNLLEQMPQNSVRHRSARAAKGHAGSGSTVPDKTLPTNSSNADHAEFLQQEWWEPRLISKTMFAISNVISLLRMLQYMVISDMVGPFQISLGSMVARTANFFVVVAIVLLSFAMGFTYLYAYYVDINALTCGPDTGVDCVEDRFTNLFYSIQYLFWSMMGIEDQTPLYLPNQARVIEDSGEFLYALFYILMVIVLLNALIAVMSEAYNSVEENADVEWKFHSTAMWMSILLDDDVVPPPFNLFPSVEKIKAFLSRCSAHAKRCLRKNGSEDFELKEKELKEEEEYRKDIEHKARYKRVIDKLVERYLTSKNEVSVSAEVTIADVLALKNDLQGLKLGVYQRLYETNHEVILTTDVSMLVRDISSRAKRVLNKTEAIHDDVDEVLLKLITDFKDYVESKRHLIKQYVEATEEEAPPPGLFSQIVGNFGSSMRSESSSTRSSPKVSPKVSTDKGQHDAVKGHHFDSKGHRDYVKGPHYDSNGQHDDIKSYNEAVKAMDRTSSPGLLTKFFGLNDDAESNEDRPSRKNSTSSILPSIFSAKGKTDEEESIAPSEDGMFSSLINNFLNNSGSFGASFDSAVVQAGDTLKLIEDTDDKQIKTSDVTNPDQDKSHVTVLQSAFTDYDKKPTTGFKLIEPAKITENQANTEEGNPGKIRKSSSKSSSSSSSYGAGKNGKDNDANRDKEDSSKPSNSLRGSDESAMWTESSSGADESVGDNNEIGKNGRVRKMSVFKGRKAVAFQSPSLTRKGGGVEKSEKGILKSSKRGMPYEKRRGSLSRSPKGKKKSISMLFRKKNTPKSLTKMVSKKGGDKESQVVEDKHQEIKKEDKAKKSSLSKLFGKKPSEVEAETTKKRDSKVKGSDDTIGVKNETSAGKDVKSEKASIGLESPNVVKKNKTTGKTDIEKKREDVEEDHHRHHKHPHRQHQRLTDKRRSISLDHDSHRLDKRRSRREESEDNHDDFSRYRYPRKKSISLDDVNDLEKVAKRKHRSKSRMEKGEVAPRSGYHFDRKKSMSLDDLDDLEKVGKRKHRSKGRREDVLRDEHEDDKMRSISLDNDGKFMKLFKGKSKPSEGRGVVKKDEDVPGKGYINKKRRSISVDHIEGWEKIAKRKSKEDRITEKKDEDTIRKGYKSDKRRSSSLDHDGMQKLSWRKRKLSKRKETEVKVEDVFDSFANYGRRRSVSMDHIDELEKAVKRRSKSRYEMGSDVAGDAVADQDKVARRTSSNGKKKRPVSLDVGQIRGVNTSHRKV